MRRVCFIIIVMVCTSMACAQKDTYSVNTGFLGSLTLGNGGFFGASVMVPGPTQWGIGLNVSIFVEEKKGAFQLGFLWRKKLNKSLSLDGSFLIGGMLTAEEKRMVSADESLTDLSISMLITHTEGLSIKISRFELNIAIETGLYADEKKPIYVAGKLGFTFDLFDNT